MNKLLPEIEKAWEKAKSFQVEDSKFAAIHGRVVLGHKTGLGKTFISLLTWSLRDDISRVIVIGTLSSSSVWRRELRKWGGAESTFIQGYSDPNWKVALDKKKSGIYLMTYATLLGLMKQTVGEVKFDLVICDEMHRVLRSRKNAVFEVAMLSLNFKYFLGLSATWASRGPQDLWPVLHLISKKLFSSYWKFVETWCFVERTNFGVEVFGVKNAGPLRKMLYERFYRARTYKEVASQFITGVISDEPVIRRIIDLPMDNWQIKIYEELKQDMYTSLDGDILVTPTSLSLLTRLLQLSIAPKVLFPGAKGNGGAIDWLVEQVAVEPHTIIFSPFEKVLEQVRQALVGDGHSNKIFTLKGGMHPDDIDTTIEAWKQCKGIITCTISFAQSFALDTTNTAYMLGFSWDPNDNIQAEGRLRRMDSILQTPCIVNYVVMEGSEYEKVKEVVNGKVFNVRQFLLGYGRDHKCDTAKNNNGNPLVFP